MDMNKRIARWNEEAAGCTCGSRHHEVRMQICMESGALHKIAPYVVSQGYKQASVVYDDNTGNAAGRKVAGLLLNAGVTVNEVLLEANKAGDVIADEAFIVKLLLGVSNNSEAVLAVGSGTVHDLVRFVCFKMNIPFLSVPTAASVDGFTSAGAPLIIGGVKQTFQATAPDAIFADLEVLSRAPQVLTAAGFGDMLGKFTSLADWKVSRDLGQEPFCPLAYLMTEEALESCITHISDIAEGSETGVSILMEALIVSGISMLMIDHSRPASGGEHHISHRLEMDFIEQGRPAILHGAKVGVASALLTDIYRGLYEKETEPAFEAYKQLPQREQMQDWLRVTGGPATLADLDVTESAFQIALATAHTLRPRYTGLTYRNERVSPEMR
ncbi:sn-glycerol-1-phosphate dehydrogenase [Paenibacillus sp. Marseille-Q4541]|uniref:sn-glycerol-1-phosphate dehydrogenase n=1 Tax=Paenibacillus sp. Marseille-Q4541 TaxID=2831522 RepID=UPI001BA72D18|nr:sn-glycerol-1-phosphate dehydrogenase [Paenibacillus sp. Marseille-Q4541]